MTNEPEGCDQLNESSQRVHSNGTACGISEERLRDVITQMKTLDKYNLMVTFRKRIPLIMHIQCFIRLRILAWVTSETGNTDLLVYTKPMNIHFRAF